MPLKYTTSRHFSKLKADSSVQGQSFSGHLAPGLKPWRLQPWACPGGKGRAQRGHSLTLLTTCTQVLEQKPSHDWVCLCLCLRQEYPSLVSPACSLHALFFPLRFRACFISCPKQTGPRATAGTISWFFCSRAGGCIGPFLPPGKE